MSPIDDDSMTVRRRRAVRTAVVLGIVAVVVYIVFILGHIQ